MRKREPGGKRDEFQIFAQSISNITRGAGAASAEESEDGEEEEEVDEFSSEEESEQESEEESEEEFCEEAEDWERLQSFFSLPR